MAEPLSPQALSYYAQMGIPVQQQPNVAAYAQQPMQQAAPPQVEQFQGLRPSPARQEYVNVIEQRFNELVKQAGGIERVTRTGLLEIARQKAMQDVQMLYGPPPEIEQPQRPLQVQPIPGTEKVMVMGPGMAKPEFVEAAKPQMPAQMQPIMDAEGRPIPGMGMLPSGEIKTFEPPQKAQEAKAKAAGENMVLVSDVVTTVDNLLADENALKWAGGMTGAVLGRVPGQTSGIRQKIEQLRDQIGLFGRKAIVGQGQGSISDAEQKMAKEALAQVITEGTDEQLINSLKAVRQKFGGILDRLQAEASGMQNGAPIPQPVQEGMAKRVFVPGKGFQ